MNDSITQDLMFENFRKLQDGQAALLREMRELKDNTNEKLGAMAQALVGVQRDVRDLKREMTTLVVAVDEHTRRLDRIDERLGLNTPTH